MDDFDGVLLKGNNGFDEIRVLDPIVAGSLVRKVTLDGGNGDDDLFAPFGNNALHGGVGNDTLVAGDGNDALFGDGGNDVISGGQGSDFMDGGDGDDQFDNRDPFPDTVLGGNGNDSAHADPQDQISGVETIFP
jgi:Ca2+-binding RTX toxin-like protein